MKPHHPGGASICDVVLTNQPIPEQASWRALVRGGPRALGAARAEPADASLSRRRDHRAHRQARARRDV